MVPKLAFVHTSHVLIPLFSQLAKENLATTLKPTLALLEATAAAAGRQVELIPKFCDGAFEAVRFSQAPI